MKRISVIFVIIFAAISVKAQVNAGPDSTICKNDIIQLQGSGPSNLEYLWTSTPNDPTISDPTIFNPTVQPSVTTIYRLTGSELDPTELVTNGDFEQGNTGFTSSYIYCDQPNCLNGSPSIGSYGIGNNPNYFNSNFAACNQPSGGSGNMMICNGDEAMNNTLYETVITGISTYTEYEMSVWITSVITAIPPVIPSFVFEINGEPIGTHNANTTSCSWSQFKNSWNSGSSTTATIRIVNTTAYPSGLGNDFALDDVSFKAILSESDYCVVTVENVATTDFDLQSSSCEGDTVTITYTGNGPSNTTYNWDFGTDAIIISGSGQGPYEVTWSSTGIKTVSLWIDNACPSDTTSHDINIDAGPDIDVTANPTSIPTGASTNLLGIINSGSNTSFTWEPAALLLDATIIDPQTVPLNQTTTFYFTVTDGTTLCSSIDSIEIEVAGGALSITSLIADPNIICSGQSTNLILDVTGGSGNYTATWSSDPPGFSYTGPEMQVVVSPIVSTTYYVDVTDGFNTVSSSVPVEILPATVITSQPQNLSLLEGSTANFTTEADNANSYLWQISVDMGSTWTDLTDGGIYSGTNTDNLTISPVDNTMNGNLFRCIVTGDCNNETSNDASLSVSDSPIFIGELDNYEVCEGELINAVCEISNFIQITDFELVVDYDNSVIQYNSLIDISIEIESNLTVQDNVGRLTFSWSATNGITMADGPAFTIVFDAIGEGTSSLEWKSNLSSVTNQPGMHPSMDLTDGEIIVKPLPLPVTGITANPDTVNITDEIDVTLTANGGFGDELIWTINSCNGDSVGSGNMIETIRPETTTSYFAYWLNQCGKSTCTEAEIVIVYNYNVGYPNAFTPNNDGLNDDFKIVSDSPLNNFKMQVFNRNGSLIFESDDQNTGWDGTYKNSIMPVGAYIWKVSYEVITKSSTMETITNSGTVTLIR